VLADNRPEVTFAEGSGNYQYYDMDKNEEENKPPHRHSGCADPFARRRSASRCVRRQGSASGTSPVIGAEPSRDGQTDRECKPYAQSWE